MRFRQYLYAPKVHTLVLFQVSLSKIFARHDHSHLTCSVFAFIALAQKLDQELGMTAKQILNEVNEAILKSKQYSSLKDPQAKSGIQTYSRK